jgi:hypothetical protein
LNSKLIFASIERGGKQLIIKSSNDNCTNFRFIVMGDSRGKSFGINEFTFRSLLESTKHLSPQPNFLLFLGDMVMGGAKLDRELKSWKSIVCDYYHINQIVPSIGNHEDNETIFSNEFNYLPNEQLPGYHRTAYCFDYCNARFIILNSVRRNAKNNYVIDINQVIWLENLLKNNRQVHSFVAFHVPAYPTGHHYGESLDSVPDMRDALWPIIDKYNVTAVLAAHEHNYSHRIIDNSFSCGSYTFKNQIHQIITGGAGAPLNSRVKDLKKLLKGHLKFIIT